MKNFIFECNTGPDEQGIKNMFEEEPIADEIKDFIFNSEITEEEILRTVRTLKEDKSAGPDGIVPGVFIHSFDLILPILLSNRIPYLFIG